MRYAYGDYSKQASRLDAFGYLARVITTFRDSVREWQRRIRVRNELMMLSDHDLRDLRWTRPDVEAEARKPFWRA